MWYYLHHYFDPEIDYRKLKPQTNTNGSIDLHNLNYVQNVLAGQILAEIRPLTKDTSPLPHKKFILKEPILPAGANTLQDSENPLCLRSAINGYVFYYDKKIMVKHLLNIHNNIDLHTGNIAFVGDMAVHGDVHSSFELRASNILVKGTVGDSFLRATDNIAIEGGFKGGQCGKLIAAKNINLSFCETGEIRAKGKIAVSGSCLHCRLYSGKDVIIKERLQGGIIRAKNKIYVGSCLGFKNNNMPTSLILGEDPFCYRNLQKIEKDIERLEKKLNLKAEFDSSLNEEKNRAPWMHILFEKLDILHNRRKLLKKRLASYKNLENCMLIVPGEVLPGVELTIGETKLKIEKPYQNVRFQLRDNEIVISSPALSHK